MNIQDNTLHTLTEALDIVAKASFYEDKWVRPVVLADDLAAGPVGYFVDDTRVRMSDDWEWSYDKGIHDRDSVAETSRLHESHESYDTADHVRYNLPGAVEALEAGRSVEFAYAVVADADAEWDEDLQEYVGVFGRITELEAGWILTANWADED